MDIAEKRVYEASAGRTRLAVATGQGLAVVGISADVIGEFGLALRESVRDVVAVGEGRLLVATEDDLRVVVLGGDGIAETVGTAATGAGPTEAVSVADVADGGASAVIAAGSDGLVRRVELSALLDAAADSDAAVDWTPLGEAAVRTADGRLLAAEDGVHRAGADGIGHVGLDDARDVAVPAAAAAFGPLAATAEGLFRLGPGWTAERSGAFDVVSARSSAPSEGPLAHAGSGEELLERVDGAWGAIEWPARASVADVAYSEEAVYAVAKDGTVLVDAGDGWRTRSIGLPDVRRCAVVR